MSQENVEIGQRVIVAFRRGDWDAVAEIVDPHVFVRTDARWPEQYIYGREAWIGFLMGVRESVGSDIHCEETIDLGDRVLERLCWVMHGHQSGVGGEQRVSSITTYRDARGVFIEFFLEHEHALKAVGLEE